ncbi:MAG TPA: L,D-transpeptidase family protein [Clostridia bacterium]|nr:L,D-transpeptidase family protein [Clostridia bacterium]
MRGRWIGLLALILIAVTQSFWSPALREASSGKRQMLIIIDTRQMSLTLYENQKAVKRYPIAAGKGGTPTPLGVFQINRKFTTKSSGFGTRFMGLNVPWGNYGIHGTNAPGSIGNHASHGCIRMFTRDAEELYRLVTIGTYVIIEGGTYGELGDSLQTLHLEERGAHVRAVQRKLKALGYYTGNPDGVYGWGTYTALRDFKQDHGLPPTDVVDSQTYQALGLMLFE